MSETTLLRQPTVNDFLSDPATRLLMRRDGVTEEQVRQLVRRTALARHGEPVSAFRPDSKGRWTQPDVRFTKNSQG